MTEKFEKKTNNAFSNTIKAKFLRKIRELKNLNIIRHKIDKTYTECFKETYKKSEI